MLFAVCSESQKLFTNKESQPPTAVTVPTPIKYISLTLAAGILTN